MFLSTGSPPNDPLSSPSSNLLHLTSSSDELGQSHPSNFSIRDYACSNRKKKIKNNWPFSPKSLQLFSTHGMTDPLPPFQKISTVRNQFETKACSSPGKQTVSYVHQGRMLAKHGLNQALAPETRKGVCNQRIIKNGLFPSHVSKSKEDSCGGGLVKISESIMASKTCPICKTFSSASNTTLNAHIDQCLSVDTALPPVSSKPNRLRVKPRMKVKSMVDIYASAKGCTLEDLDKRNGTKWASILSYTNRVDKPEVSKKRKVSPVGVGPVYIDAMGQKLRILSEFSEKKTSTTPSREQHKDDSSEKKCLSQGSKGNSTYLRKNRQGKKHQKYVKPTNRKANEIPESKNGFAGEGSSIGHRRIYNQQMLAKHSLISRKLNEKGHKFYSLGDQPSANDDDSWSGGDPTVLRSTELSATDSYRLNKQKPRSKVAGRNTTLFESKRAQSRSFRVWMDEKKGSLGGVHTNTLRLKKSLASIEEDKYPPRKNFCSDAEEVSDTSPRETSMRKLSPPWRRLSTPVELKKTLLDFSGEEDEEETGKWESEMTHECVLSDDDYVSGDNGETNKVLLRNPSSTGYKDSSDEESSEEEEDNNKRDNVLKKTNDTSAEFYHSETPSVEIIPSELAMFNPEEVGNMINGQTTCEKELRFESEVRQGSLFVEVDTIPIPGPPGSFLPSPRDMVFDENLGNSSVITSQLQYSIDQHDRNSSESPLSAVSNFAAGRLVFPTELFSSDIPATSLSFCVPSHHGTIAGPEPITIDKKTTPSRFRNNDHESCCCQRKERISEGITLNHQASNLLQRRAASSSIAMNLTKSPKRLDPNHPYKIQQDLNLQSKLSSRKNLNCNVSPSPSNSVIRLMGKDLMVMNQGEADEEASWSSLTRTPQFLAYTSTQAQASAFRNNFDHLRYVSPS